MWPQQRRAFIRKIKAGKPYFVLQLQRNVFKTGVWVHKKVSRQRRQRPLPWRRRRRVQIKDQYQFFPGAVRNQRQQRYRGQNLLLQIFQPQRMPCLNGSLERRSHQSCEWVRQRKQNEGQIQFPIQRYRKRWRRRRIWEGC